MMMNKQTDRQTDKKWKTLCAEEAQPCANDSNLKLATSAKAPPGEASETFFSRTPTNNPPTTRPRYLTRRARRICKTAGLRDDNPNARV